MFNNGFILQLRGDYPVRTSVFSALRQIVYMKKQPLENRDKLLDRAGVDLEAVYTQFAVHKSSTD